jgi:hypothetical protein
VCQKGIRGASTAAGKDVAGVEQIPLFYSTDWYLFRENDMFRLLLFYVIGKLNKILRLIEASFLLLQTNNTKLNCVSWFPVFRFVLLSLCAV